MYSTFLKAEKLKKHGFSVSRLHEVYQDWHWTVPTRSDRDFRRIDWYCTKPVLMVLSRCFEAILNVFWNNTIIFTPPVFIAKWSSATESRDPAHIPVNLICVRIPTSALVSTIGRTNYNATHSSAPEGYQLPRGRPACGLKLNVFQLSEIIRISILNFSSTFPERFPTNQNPPAVFLNFPSQLSFYHST